MLLYRVKQGARCNGKTTGPGKTEKRTNPPSLMLYNFDIDGDQLKDEHKKFLRAEAFPTLSGRRQRQYHRPDGPQGQHGSQPSPI